MADDRWALVVGASRGRENPVPVRIAGWLGSLPFQGRGPVGGTGWAGADWCGLPVVKPATFWKLSPYQSLALGPDP